MRILVLTQWLPVAAQAGPPMRIVGLFGYLAERHDLTFAWAPPAELDATDTPHQLPFGQLVALPPLAVQWPLENPTHRIVNSALSRLRLYKWRDVLLFDPALSIGWIAPMPNAVRSALTEHLEQNEYDMIVVESEALLNAARLHWPRNAVLLLNSQNVLSSQIESDQNGAGHRLGFWDKLWLWKIASYYEAWTSRKFDHVVAVSEIDRQRWSARLPGKSIGIVGNGVDTDFFAPMDAGDEKGHDISFVGGANYAPNKSAMLELVNDIFPRVRAAVPDATLTVIGRNPPLEEFTFQDGVRALGFVDDIRPSLAASALFVAPIRQGGGTRIKILTAMSMGKAVEATPLGAEGLEVRSGHDIIIAERTKELADAAVDLLRRPERRRTLGDNARATVLEHYDWRRLSEEFERQMLQTVARKRRSKGQHA